MDYWYLWKTIFRTLGISKNPLNPFKIPIPTPASDFCTRCGRSLERREPKIIIRIYHSHHTMETVFGLLGKGVGSLASVAMRSMKTAPRSAVLFLWSKLAFFLFGLSFPLLLISSPPSFSPSVHRIDIVGCLRSVTRVWARVSWSHEQRQQRHQQRSKHHEQLSLQLSKINILHENR